MRLNRTHIELFEVPIVDYQDSISCCRGAMSACKWHKYKGFMILKPTSERVKDQLEKGFRLQSIHWYNENQCRFVFSGTKETTERELEQLEKRYLERKKELQELLSD